MRQRAVSRAAETLRPRVPHGFFGIELRHLGAAVDLIDELLQGLAGDRGGVERRGPVSHIVDDLIGTEARRQVQTTRASQLSAASPTPTRRPCNVRFVSPASKRSSVGRHENLLGLPGRKGAGLLRSTHPQLQACHGRYPGSARPVRVRVSLDAAGKEDDACVHACMCVCVCARCAEGRRF